MHPSSALVPALAAITALAATGCSPRRAAESLLLGSHFVRTEGVAYGPEARQRLDVYRPKAVRAPAPLVVFLHGGRWNSGTRGDYRLLGDALTRRGWVTVVPDYRLAPAARFPAWVEDGARAVRWARDNAARLGGDSTRIFVVGHSAGGHSAALLALDEHFLRDAGVPAGAVRGFVSLAGPVDTTWTDPDIQALMGPREGWPATYPTTHVDGTDPPLLLLHGGGDRTVAVENSVRLATRIRDRGGCARSIVYAGVGHVQIVVALSAPRLRIAPVLDDIDAFVRDPRRGCTATG
ncbi:MAG TPA: alpha/beta hydrolase [Longimicrobium sp.]|jgi:acetyl esterase/lipase